MSQPHFIKYIDFHRNVHVERLPSDPGEAIVFIGTIRGTYSACALVNDQGETVEILNHSWGVVEG